MFEKHDPEPEDEARTDEETEEIEEGTVAPAALGLDPDALRSQRFILSFFGYDRGEVRAFLAHIADRLEETEKGPVAAGTSSFAGLGDEVARILTTTTEAAVELREKLVAEARLVHGEAEGEARATKERAEARAREVVEIAERRAAETVSEAEERAAALVREAEEEAGRIRATEHEARVELAALREVLSNVTETLEPEEDR